MHYEREGTPTEQLLSRDISFHMRYLMRNKLQMNTLRGLKDVTDDVEGRVLT